MNNVRVIPWHDNDPAPDALLAAMQARRPGGELKAVATVAAYNMVSRFLVALHI